MAATEVGANVPQEDQPPTSDPQGSASRPAGGTPQPPQANSSLSEVRDYMDWLENQRRPSTRNRARGVIVLVVIVLVLSGILLLWWR
jgi:hypothetical protein